MRYLLPGLRWKLRFRPNLLTGQMDKVTPIKVTTNEANGEGNVNAGTYQSTTPENTPVVQPTTTENVDNPPVVQPEETVQEEQPPRLPKDRPKRVQDTKEWEECTKTSG